MTEPSPSPQSPAAGLAPSPLRSVLSIAVGFFLRNSLARIGAALIASVTGGAAATRGLFMEVVWAGIAAVFAGLAAGIVAGRYEIRHGLVLAAIFLGMGAFAAGREPGQVGWNLAIAAVSAFAVVWGAALAAAARRKRVRRLRTIARTP